METLFMAQIDGKPLSADKIGKELPRDPGNYTIEVRFEQRVVTKLIKLGRGQALRVKLALPAREIAKPPPAPDPGPHPLWIGGWVAVGVGTVGIVVGAVAGGLVLSQEDELLARCAERKCPPDVHAEAEAFETKRTLATAGFIVGIVGAAAGIALLLLAPSSSSSSTSDDGDDNTAASSIVPYITPNSIGVAGAF